MSNLVHVYRKIKPAVVAIGLPADGLPGGGGEPPYLIAGTGFCVDPRGFLLSCRHVFEGLQELVPDFRENFEKMKENPGQVHRMNAIVPYALFFFERASQVVVLPVQLTDIVVKTDLDIAVMRAGAQYFRSPDEPYPTVKLGDSNTLKEGQELATCGFPFGKELHSQAVSANSSLSAGIVSAILPSPGVIAVVPENFTRFQVDMTMNRGNSGGPVFRPADGEVLGISGGGL